jgi:hypothetical protein
LCTKSGKSCEEHHNALMHQASGLQEGGREASCKGVMVHHMRATWPRVASMCGAPHAGSRARGRVCARSASLTMTRVNVRGASRVFVQARHDYAHIQLYAFTPTSCGRRGTPLLATASNGTSHSCHRSLARGVNRLCASRLAAQTHIVVVAVVVVNKAKALQCV